MKNTLLFIFITIAFVGCGDNVFATIDNSSNDETNYYGDSSYDINASKYDCESSGYLYCGKCLELDNEIYRCSETSEQ